MFDLNAVVSAATATPNEFAVDEVIAPQGESCLALVPPLRLQTVIQEQRCRFPLLDYSQDLVAVCDFNGFLAYLNPIGRELMGLAPDGDLSLFQVRCFTPLTQDLWDEIFTSLLEEGLWSGDHVLQYGGDPIAVKMLVTAHRPCAHDQQNIDCFTIVARVQTPSSSRQPAMTAIEAECQRLRHLVGNINDVLFEVNLDGQFTYLSPRFEEFFGHPSSDWLGKSPLMLTHPDDCDFMLEHMRQIVTTGCRDQVEFRILQADGNSRWMAVSNSPCFDAAGEIVGFQGSLRDISDRKAASEALKSKTLYLERALKNLQQARTHMVQSEKMSSLGQLVAGVAHEINNPVNFIYGNLKYADRYIEDLINVLDQYRVACPNPPAPLQETIDEVDVNYLVEDLPKMLNSMKVGADRIREIVLSLRTFSRLDESDYKPADLHAGIASTLLILQNRLKGKEHRPAINIVQDFCELPLVPCFAGQLNQVFMNLLVNAIDALEDAYDAGYITVPEICIQTLMLGDMVQMQFKDNGPGIPDAVKERLFDPFFTTKPVGQGTGMGLAISYQIIRDKHHGFLTCASTPGEGTTFEIQIPLTQPEHA
ncbi:PAS domain S-box protein [filamentous cyanobacterium LEGE 11480]|uniref:histidine kinase n=1 Tax=Romeriopsis navalis LEGE 11480 TaxID=2777977 RepID=A0A928VKZ1_9CYAN|nr:PAS domain S-box protein [Romeriopsis navalis]MBE9028526.1 PAS domain S-box protein [Romeriopsis navalis LEGE 11480]